MFDTVQVLLLIVVVIGVAAWLILRSTKRADSRTPTVESPKSVAAKSTAKPRIVEGDDWIAFKEPIQKGWRIYAGGLEVRGVHVEPHRSAVTRFADGSEQRLSLETDRGNPHDPNAIKIIGHFKKWATTSAIMLGYVPREIAEALAATGLLRDVTPRLTFLRVREGRTPTVQFDILIPKDKRQALDEFHEEKLMNGPMTVEQKDYASFFGLKLPRKATFGEAREVIDAHKTTSRAEAPERFAEWEAYWRICEAFDDPSERCDYSIKAVSRKLLNEAIDSLKKEGITLAELADEVEFVAEWLIETHPELERDD